MKKILFLTLSFITTLLHTHAMIEPENNYIVVHDNNIQNLEEAIISLESSSINLKIASHGLGIQNVRGLSLENFEDVLGILIHTNCPVKNFIFMANKEMSNRFFYELSTNKKIQRLFQGLESLYLFAIPSFEQPKILFGYSFPREEVITIIGEPITSIAQVFNNLQTLSVPFISSINDSFALSILLQVLPNLKAVTVPNNPAILSQIAKHPSIQKVKLQYGFDQTSRLYNGSEIFDLVCSSFSDQFRFCHAPADSSSIIKKQINPKSQSLYFNWDYTMWERQ